MNAGCLWEEDVIPFLQFPITIVLDKTNPLSIRYRVILSTDPAVVDESMSSGKYAVDGELRDPRLIKMIGQVALREWTSSLYKNQVASAVLSKTLRTLHLLENGNSWVNQALKLVNGAK